MMPRATWSGTTWFGLVSAPVRMFAAGESKELRFLHKCEGQVEAYEREEGRT